MIKIKFECWWIDSESLNNRITKQFIPEEDKTKYSLTTVNQDFTIVLGNTNWEKLTTKKTETFYISQEPLWSPNEPKNNLHEFCDKILIADKTYYPESPEYIETLLPMLYAGRGESDIREEWDWSKEIKNKKYEKNKGISLIVTKNYNSHFEFLSKQNVAEIIYKLRTDLGDLLSKNEYIDVYGTFWEKDKKNIKGEVWNKHVALDDYKFSFAFENTIQKNYISEKFWDVILTNTVPIYIGCSNILDYIPNESFIYLNNLFFNDILEKTKYINENKDKLYDNYVTEINKLKNKFFSDPKFNLWEKIKKDLIGE